MTPSIRPGWRHILAVAIVCTVVGVIIFLAQLIVRAQQDSATLAAAQRLVMILEDHHQKHGQFPGSLTDLFVDSTSSSNRPPEVLGRFAYRSDGRSYELKFEAGGPVVLNRKDNPPDPVHER